MDATASLSNGDVNAITGLGTQVEVLRQSVSSLQAQFVESRTSQNARINELSNAMQSGFERQANALQALRDLMAASGKPNWGIWLACAGLLVGLGTAAVAFISIEAQLTVGPVKSDVAALQAGALTLASAVTKTEDRLGLHDAELQKNDGRDSRSEQDRSDLSLRLDRLTDQVGKVSGEVIASASALTEIETQFRADELVAAQRESNTEQWKGIFFRRLYHVPLPQRGPVVPGIARAPRG